MLQQPYDKIFGLGGDVLGYLEVDLGDTLVGSCTIRGRWMDRIVSLYILFLNRQRLTTMASQVFEWRYPNEEFVGQNAERPQIYFLRVIATFDHLWW